MDNFHPLKRYADTISQRSRAKKFSQFLSLTAPQPDETIIDVGINTEEYSESDNYLEKYYPHPHNITALGQGDMSTFAKRYSAIQSVSGDGRALPFAENAFTISYSNAVIEHVGGYDDQLQFLKELVRVAKRGYLTTPNRLFPIEIHTRIPLLHILLPKKAFDTVLRWVGKSWATDDYMNLLSEEDLRTLLRHANITNYTLIKNRFCGLPMTFTILWDKHSN